jgi:hypothetical protein
MKDELDIVERDIIAPIRERLATGLGPLGALAVLGILTEETLWRMPKAERMRMAREFVETITKGMARNRTHIKEPEART